MNIQAVSCSFGSVSVPLVSPRTRFVIKAKSEPSEKSVELMRKFSEQYARRSGTYFCVDKGVTSVVIKGLAEHKDSYGAPLCPCGHYDDKAAEVGQGFWNCPCVPMRERRECHCMLFLTPDNDFAGKDQTITSDEIKETTANIDGLPGEGKGIPYLYLTPLDPTTRNAKKDSRASLTISESPIGTCKMDPMDPTCSKLTLTGKLLPLVEGSVEEKAAKKALFTKHPEMMDWSKGHDFRVFKLEIVDIFLISWYGGAKSITVDEYLCYKPINVASFVMKIFKGVEQNVKH